MRSLFAAVVVCGLAAGCSTAPDRPIEPDMSRLVPVNKAVPAELVQPLHAEEEPTKRG